MIDIQLVPMWACIVAVRVVNVNTTVLIESAESHQLFRGILPAEARWTGCYSDSSLHNFCWSDWGNVLQCYLGFISAVGLNWGKIFSCKSCVICGLNPDYACACLNLEGD